MSEPYPEELIAHPEWMSEKQLAELLDDIGSGELEREHAARILVFEAFERQQAQVARMREAIQDALDEIPNIYVMATWAQVKSAYDILRAALAEEQQPEPATCPKCGSDIGHRINCPDGIAFTKEQP